MLFALAVGEPIEQMFPPPRDTQGRALPYPMVSAQPVLPPLAPETPPRRGRPRRKGTRPR